MSLFSSITGAELKDCFVDDMGLLVFITRENQIGRAIGKNGTRARMLEKAVNRKIKILEFNPELTGFIKNVIYPLMAKSIEAVDSTVNIEAADLKTRGLLIGRSARNLHNIESYVKRYFDIDKIRVL